MELLLVLWHHGCNFFRAFKHQVVLGLDPLLTQPLPRQLVVAIAFVQVTVDE